MAVQVKKKEGGIRTLTDVLGARVRARRADLGMSSQGELARLMREGRGHSWNSGTVSRLEAGLVEPTFSELVSLMLILRSTFEELTDPVVAGNEPVEFGFKEPQPAEHVRDYLAGKRLQVIVLPAPEAE